MNERKISFLVLEAMFFLAALVVALTFDVTRIPLVVVLGALPLAASHMGRSISYYGIGEPIRAKLTKVVEHSSGAGEDVHPAFEDGWKSVIGELICCPICSGTWSGLALLMAYVLVPSFGTVLILLFASAAVAGFVTRYSEKVEWEKHYTRERTGYWNRFNKADRQEINLVTRLMDPEKWQDDWDWQDMDEWARQNPEVGNLHVERK